MKYALTALAVAGAMIVAEAVAELGAVVSSFPAPPRSYPMALARSRDALYAYCKLDAGPARALIYKLNPQTGSIENEFGLPRRPYENYGGLAYTSDGSLWTANGTIDSLYQLDAETGSVKKSFALYGAGVTGLAARHNPATGGPIRGIWAKTYRPEGITLYDHVTGEIKVQWLWSPDGFDIAWLYGKGLLLSGLITESGYYCQAFTPQGKVVATFPAPTRNELYGFAYYEGYLWVSATRTEASYDPYIWQLDVRDLLAVNPASLGRVKALFR
jgi:streptogramin lyase